MQKRATQPEDSSPPVDSTIVRLLRYIYRPLPLTVAAAWLGYWTLSPHVARWLPDLQQREEYRLVLSEMRLTPPGRWVPASLVDEVAERSSLPQPLPLLDPGLAEQVAQAFRAHPWVEGVREVRVTPRDGIAVHLDYRAPVLMAQTKRGVYPVDRAGVLLPPQDFSAEHTAEFPLLINAPSIPQGPAGTPWGDPAVEGAARLAEVLAPGQRLSDYWQRLGLEAIALLPRTQTGDKPAAPQYELLTDSGTRILWGHAPGEDVLEPSPAQKLDRLLRYLDAYGGFDQPYGPRRLDIHHWEEISQEPLDFSRQPR